MAARTPSRTVLVVIGALVAVLVVMAIVFAVQPPKQLDPHTPEGTAQGYFQAVNSSDLDLAETYLTDELRDACEWDRWFLEDSANSRVVITDTTTAGENAEVAVTISISYGDEPFGADSYDQKDTLTMERSGDLWLISEPVWPIDSYFCHEGEG